MMRLERAAPAHGRLCEEFRMLAIDEISTRTGAGVRKSSGKEPAGGWARSVPRLLWVFGGRAWPVGLVRGAYRTVV